MMAALALPFPRVLAMAALFGRRSTPAPGGLGSPGAPAAETRASGYDRVGVGLEDGEMRWLSKGEFQALPLVDRVRILAGGGAKFYRGPMEISAMEAMRGLP